MIAATLAEQKKAKLKFFAAYVVSIVLVMIIFASLWRDHSSAALTSDVPAATPSHEKFVQVYTALEARLQELDNLTISLVSSKEKSGPKVQAVQAAQASVKNSLDSLSKDAATVSDEEERQELINLVAGFRKTADNNAGLLTGYLSVLNDTSRVVVRTNTVVQNVPVKDDAAMQELKAMLVEKEQRITGLEQQRQNEVAEKNKTITSLQGQLKQAQNGRQTIVNVPQTVTGGDPELKQKVATLKSTNDKLSAQNATLNNAYKALVEDNRRLLTQIQSMRKQ